MKEGFSDVSARTAVRIAGISLLGMFIVALLDAVLVDQGMIVWNDASRTFSNIEELVMQYRLHILFYMLIFILDIVVALGLYLVLRPVNRSLSLLGAWFRVMYAAMIGAITVNQLDVLRLVGSAGYLSAYEPAQLHSMVMSSLYSQADGFSYALIFFGFHILLVGYLVYRSGYMPKILALFLAFAFVGYLMDGFANLLFPGFRTQNKAFLEGFLGIAGIIGELFLALYLVIKGRKVAEAIESRQS